MSAEPRRHLYKFGLLAGGAALLCLIAAVTALSLHPPEFRDHKETVAYVLRQRGIAFRDIAFHQSYEESVNLRIFSAAVQVELADGRVVNGWVGCENGDAMCFLELRGVGIRGDRLPDVTGGQRWGWQSWLDSATSWFNQHMAAP